MLKKTSDGLKSQFLFVQICVSKQRDRFFYLCLTVGDSAAVLFPLLCIFTLFEQLIFGDTQKNLAKLTVM